MLKYLKPRVIPITFVIFFFGNIMTFLIVWGLIGFIAFESLSDQIAVIIMIIGIFPALVATRLFYSSVLPIWVVYSVKKTENLHFLKYFLVQSKVISNKILESESDELIKYKTLKSDTTGFIDDKTVPNETEIKKSYADFFMILFCTIGLPVMNYQYNPENRTFGFLVFVVGFVIGTRELIKLRNQKFTFKLSNNGVWIAENELIMWNQIRKKNTTTEFHSDYIQRTAKRWFFTFDYNAANKEKHEYKIQINNLNINDGRLNYLIYVYKNRYFNNEKNNR